MVANADEQCEMSSDVRRLRRALRALLRQRGGSMVMRLPACGAPVRMDCSLDGCLAAVVIRSGTATVHSIAQMAFAALQAECARAGYRDAAIECAASTPVDAPLNRAA